MQNVKNYSEPQSINENLVYVFAQANQKVHKDLEMRLKAEGMQISHWRILEVLSDRRPRAMGELAIKVLMNHPTLTKMLDRIMQQGLINRALDEYDNRRVLVTITDKGMELYKKLKVHATDCHCAFEESLGKQKWQELKSLLDEIIRKN